MNSGVQIHPIPEIQNLNSGSKLCFQVLAFFFFFLIKILEIKPNNVSLYKKPKRKMKYTRVNTLQTSN